MNKIEWTLTGLFIVIMLVLSIVVNNYTNDSAEAQCVAQGGEYFRAVKAKQSLCRLPSKVDSLPAR